MSDLMVFKHSLPEAFIILAKLQCSDLPAKFKSPATTLRGPRPLKQEIPSIPGPSPLMTHLGPIVPITMLTSLLKSDSRSKSNSTSRTSSVKCIEAHLNLTAKRVITTRNRDNPGPLSLGTSASLTSWATRNKVAHLTDLQKLPQPRS